MGNDHHGAGVIDERALQDTLGLHVEVVRRLVKNQEICGLQQHAHEGDAGAFATGEDADLFEYVVSSEKEAA